MLKSSLNISHIMNIPIELRVLILQRLDFLSLLSCRTVCKSLCNIIDETATLQYIIELAVAGMVNGPSSRVGTSKRIDMLRKHKEAWTNLEWQQEETITSEEGGFWCLSGNVFASSVGGRRLEFIRLPSVIKGIKKTTWQIDDVGFYMSDFAMDPAQELLILVQSHHCPHHGAEICSLHFRSLLTGKQHPLSIGRDGVTLFMTPGGITSWDYTIQVFQDYVCVVAESNDVRLSVLLVFNWKTGVLQMSLQSVEVSSAAFLSDQYLVIGTRYEDKAALVVLNFRGIDPPMNTFTFQSDFGCWFMLPETYAEDDMDVVISSSSPAPKSLLTNADAEHPFSVSPRGRLLAVTLSNSTERLASFLVPSKSLLDAVSDLPCGPALLPRVTHKWDDWGPGATHEIRAPVSSGHPCHYDMFNTYGSKHVRVLDGTVSLYDTHRLASRQSQKEVYGPSHLRLDATNEGTVSAAVNKMLPYRVRQVSCPSSVSWAMIAEDCIILVSSDFNVETTLRFLIF